MTNPHDWKKESTDSNSQPINPASLETSVAQEDESNLSLASMTCPEGKKEGGDVVLSQENIQHTTRVYDSALGMRSPSESKNLQQRFNSWIPEGVWRINGKLDPNFVDWLAKDWMKSFGGDFDRKRADVLRHFKKDPANIAIAWGQYEAETRHRYENASVRMNNGMEINAEEQQQLLSRSRAVSEKMSDEVNPVAVDVINPVYLPQIQGGKEEKVIDCHREDKPALMANNEGVASSDNSFFQEVKDLEGKETNSVDSSSAIGAMSQADSTPAKDIPRNEDGTAENPDAYRIWQPEKFDGKKVNPHQFRERLASLSQRFAMPKPVQQFESKDPIDELNRWIVDPILRNEVMARVMKSDNLTVEFDEEGVPIRVVKMRQS